MQFSSVILSYVKSLLYRNSSGSAEEVFKGLQINVIIKLNIEGLQV